MKKLLLTLALLTSTFISASIRVEIAGDHKKTNLDGTEYTREFKSILTFDDKEEKAELKIDHTTLVYTLVQVDKNTATFTIDIFHTNEYGEIVTIPKLTLVPEWDKKASVSMGLKNKQTNESENFTLFVTAYQE